MKFAAALALIAVAAAIPQTDVNVVDPTVNGNRVVADSTVKDNNVVAGNRVAKGNDGNAVGNRRAVIDDNNRIGNRVAKDNTIAKDNTKINAEDATVFNLTGNEVNDSTIVAGNTINNDFDIVAINFPFPVPPPPAFVDGFVREVQAEVDAPPPAPVIADIATDIAAECNTRGRFPPPVVNRAFIFRVLRRMAARGAGPVPNFRAAAVIVRMFMTLAHQ